MYLLGGIELDLRRKKLKGDTTVTDHQYQENNRIGLNDFQSIRNFRFCLTFCNLPAQKSKVAQI